MAEFLRQRLESLEGTSAKRALAPRQGIDFSSNDYLGFAQDPELRANILRAMADLPNGSTGSRLLRGNLDVFEKSEKVLAEFSGTEAAVIFPSGFQANVALLSGILKKGDAVFSDELNHASLVDGIRLSGADKNIFPHRNLGALEELLKNSVAPNKVIVTESLFSMDGDLANLVDLHFLAEKYSAHLVIDEAHTTGLWGSGLSQTRLRNRSRVLATTHTGGKSLGVGGAWIACSELVKEMLVNFSRPLIFSTAPIPAVPVALAEAVHHWKKNGTSQAMACFRNAELLQSLLSDKLGRPNLNGPIIPIILGENERAVRVAAQLREQGYDVRAIRPPTVPQGQARLRLTCNAWQTPAVVTGFCQALKRCME